MCILCHLGTLAPPGEYDWNCAHWRHLVNAIELVLPSAHLNPQPKRQIDQFSHFCTAHGRKSPHFTMGNPFPKIAPSHGGPGSPSNVWFLGPVRAYNPNGITISSAVFARVTAECPYTLQWAARSPLKTAPSRWGSGLVPWAHQSPQPKRHLDRFSRFLHGSLVWQTDRQTDRPTDHDATRSVTIDRIYVRSSGDALVAAMRSKNEKKNCLGVILKDNGTTGRWESTSTIGHRVMGVRPVVLTTEWPMTRQHGLTSRPFSCFWTLASYVDGKQRL